MEDQHRPYVLVTEQFWIWYLFVSISCRSGSSGNVLIVVSILRLRGAGFRPGWLAGLCILLGSAGFRPGWLAGLFILLRSAGFRPGWHSPWPDSGWLVILLRGAGFGPGWLAGLLWVDPARAWHGWGSLFFRHSHYRLVGWLPLAGTQ